MVPTLQDKILEIVAEQLNVNAAPLKSGEHRLIALGCDSLDFVEMVMSIEDEAVARGALPSFSLEDARFPDEQYMTVADFVAECVRQVEAGIAVSAARH